VSRPKIIGPDIHGLHTASGSAQKKLDFLVNFTKEAQALGVSMHAITHHEYIEVEESRTSPPPASRLDVTAQIASIVNETIGASASQIWAGEVGPHNGASPPCDHTSMRWANFADTFW
jgi:hypothetical protein